MSSHCPICKMEIENLNEIKTECIGSGEDHDMQCYCDRCKRKIG